MAMTASIARPYSRAILEIAKEDNQLDKWSKLLELIFVLVKEPSFADIIESPKVTAETLELIIFDICEKELDLSDKERNFIKLLLLYQRLPLIAEIRELYEELRAEAENRLEAVITSSVKVESEQIVKLEKALSSKLNKRVSLTCALDESLMGGAVIKAGDLVIDGSVIGQLNKLATEISR